MGRTVSLTGGRPTGRNVGTRNRIGPKIMVRPLSWLIAGKLELFNLFHETILAIEEGK